MHKTMERFRGFTSSAANNIHRKKEEGRKREENRREEGSRREEGRRIQEGRKRGNQDPEILQIKTVSI